ncbi:MAG: hypothetical protein ACLQIB_15495 [Isosphaeraceae bacterium]
MTTRATSSATIRAAGGIEKILFRHSHSSTSSSMSSPGRLSRTTAAAELGQHLSAT